MYIFSSNISVTCKSFSSNLLMKSWEVAIEAFERYQLIPNEANESNYVAHLVYRNSEVPPSLLNASHCS